jgi:hypothetical protein
MATDLTPVFHCTLKSPPAFGSMWWCADGPAAKNIFVVLDRGALPDGYVRLGNIYERDLDWSEALDVFPCGFEPHTPGPGEAALAAGRMLDHMAWRREIDGRLVDLVTGRMREDVRERLVREVGLRFGMSARALTRVELLELLAVTTADVEALPAQRRFGLETWWWAKRDDGGPFRVMQEDDAILVLEHITADPARAVIYNRDVRDPTPDYAPVGAEAVEFEATWSRAKAERQHADRCALVRSDVEAKMERERFDVVDVDANGHGLPGTLLVCARCGWQDTSSVLVKPLHTNLRSLWWANPEAKGVDLGPWWITASTERNDGSGRVVLEHASSADVVRGTRWHGTVDEFARAFRPASAKDVEAFSAPITPDDDRATDDKPTPDEAPVAGRAVERDVLAGQAPPPAAPLREVVAGRSPTPRCGQTWERLTGSEPRQRAHLIDYDFSRGPTGQFLARVDGERIWIGEHRLAANPYHNDPGWRFVEGPTEPETTWEVVERIVRLEAKSPPVSVTAERWNQFLLAIVERPGQGPGAHEDEWEGILRGAIRDARADAREVEDILNHRLTVQGAPRKPVSRREAIGTFAKDIARERERRGRFEGQGYEAGLSVPDGAIRWRGSLIRPLMLHAKLREFAERDQSRAAEKVAGDENGDENGGEW